MIVFEKIRFKNLLSVGNYFVEFDLNNYKNTVLVGKNGAAKSTLIVAIYYALFGKSFRKVNLSQLINSINNGHLVAEIEFTKNNKHHYRIRRGMKPDIFEVYRDGVLVEQEASKKDFQADLEKNVIGFNTKSFPQIVILGSSSHTPFMELEAKDRRVVIETLLDLEVFSGMNKIAKAKLDSVKREIVDVDNDLYKLKQERENLQRYIERLQSDNQTKISENIVKIDEQSELLGKLLSQLEEIEKSVDDEEVKKYKTARDKVTKSISIKERTIGGFEGENRTTQKQIDFFLNNAECPTCNTEISTEHRDLHVKKLKDIFDSNAEQISLFMEEVKKAKEVLGKIDSKLEEFSEIRSKIQKFRLNKDNIELSIKRLTEENEKLALTDSTQIEEEELLQIGEREAVINQNKEALLKKKGFLEVSVVFLKDNGIKSKVISQYIDLINESINSYMQKLNLFVRFELNENFEETIKSRHVDCFKYQSFSSGERHKIDLSILFMFIDIASRKNNLKTNLLLLDEILDSSLDSEAKQLALKMIKNSADKNTIIITHSDEIIESINGSKDILVRAVKKGNFSYYEYIT